MGGNGPPQLKALCTVYIPDIHTINSEIVLCQEGFGYPIRIVCCSGCLNVAKRPPRVVYSSSVSSQTVKGPSFTRDTCIMAPNFPVSTRLVSWRARATNAS